MSPVRARPRTLYVLIFANVIVLAFAVAALLWANSLAGRADGAEDRGYASCVRGNVLREVARFAMVELGSPERARLPEIQEQPCAEIYPGGER